MFILHYKSIRNCLLSSYSSWGDYQSQPWGYRILVVGPYIKFIYYYKVSCHLCAMIHGGTRVDLNQPNIEEAINHEIVSKYLEWFLVTPHQIRATLYGVGYDLLKFWLYFWEKYIHATNILLMFSYFHTLRWELNYSWFHMLPLISELLNWFECLAIELLVRWTYRFLRLSNSNYSAENLT